MIHFYSSTDKYTEAGHYDSDKVEYISLVNSEVIMKSDLIDCLHNMADLDNTLIQIYYSEKDQRITIIRKGNEG